MTTKQAVVLCRNLWLYACIYCSKLVWHGNSTFCQTVCLMHSSCCHTEWFVWLHPLALSQHSVLQHCWSSQKCWTANPACFSCCIIYDYRGCVLVRKLQASWFCTHGCECTFTCTHMCARTITLHFMSPLTKKPCTWNFQATKAEGLQFQLASMCFNCSEKKAAQGHQWAPSGFVHP